MELTLEQSKQFLLYLIDIGVITNAEQNDIIEKINGQQKRCLFLFADFIKKLTPSDCYDVALRMMQKWSENIQHQQQKQQKQQGLTSNIRKNKKLPSKITEEEIEETQVETLVEGPYTNTKNIYDVQKKIEQIYNSMQPDHDKEKNETTLLDYQSCNYNPQSNNYLQNNYKTQQISSKILQNVQIQQKIKSEKQFFTEQLQKVSRIVYLKQIKNLKYSFSMLKNHILKQKINNSNNSFSNKNQNSNNYSKNKLIGYTNSNSCSSLLNIQTNNPCNTMSNNDRSQNNLHSNSSNNLNSHSSNHLYSNSSNQFTDQSFPINKNNNSMNVIQQQQLSDIPTSNNFVKNKQIMQINTNDELQADLCDNFKNINTNQNYKYQTGYSKYQKQQNEPISNSNNSSISYQNNSQNSNVQSYGNSFQQSQKFDENKACTFRQRSNLISPTNNATIQFNFSALNSANATPELFNRQQQFQHPEQIMEYSPSSTSTVNIQLKSGSFLQSSQQNQRLSDQLTHLDNGQNYQQYFENDEDESYIINRQKYEQRQFFDNEDEELNIQFYKDKEKKDMSERERILQNNFNNDNNTFVGSLDAEEISMIKHAECNQQDYNYCYDEQKCSQQTQNQHQSYISNINPSNNQLNYLANIHNYSHISKNLDDSSSLNFEASVRSQSKPFSGQNQTQKQQAQATANNNTNSFLMQSYDIFTNRQIQNVSRIGEQLGLSQMNPFMSEMQYSNIKQQPEADNQQSVNIFGLIDQSQIEKPFIFEDEQDQLLLSSTTENCSIQNKISSVQSSYQHPNLQQIETQSLNITAQNQKQQNNKNYITNQNKYGQDIQSNHIYIEKHENQINSEDESNTQNSIENKNNNQLNISNEQSSQNNSQGTNSNQYVENNLQVDDKYIKQDNKQQYIDNKHANQTYIHTQEQTIKQNVLNSQQKKEYQELQQMCKSQKVALYSFDDDEDNQNDNTNMQKSNINETKQIQDVSQNQQRNQYINERQQYNIQQNNKIINYKQIQQNNHLQNEITEEPDETHYLMIQPQEHQQIQGDKNQQKLQINSEFSQQNFASNFIISEEKSAISKSKSTVALKDLYMDFNTQPDRKKSEQNNSECSNSQQKSKQHSLQDQNNTIYEKLYNLSKHKEQGLRYLEEIKVKQELKDCTFTPQLIAKNKAISRKDSKSHIETFNDKENNIRANNINFTFENQENKFDSQIAHKRLYDDAKMRKQIDMHIQDIKSQKETKDCTFQPKLISKTQKSSQMISEKETQSTRDSQKNLSVFEKLYKDNQIKQFYQTLNIREKEEKELEKCTFKPQICELSNKISRSKSPNLSKQILINFKDKPIEIQNERSSSLKSESMKRNSKDREVNELAKFYKKNSQSSLQNQQINIISTRNRSSSNHLNSKNLSKDQSSVEDKNNLHNSITNYIERQEIQTTFMNKIKTDQLIQQQEEQDIPFKSSCSPIGFQGQKKQLTHSLKGCIDPKIELQIKGSRKSLHEITTNQSQFNQPISINPSVNTLSSTFDQMIQKKFKLQQSSEQIPQKNILNNYLNSQNQQIRGSQSVKSSKSISFNKNKSFEEQEELRQHTNSTINQNNKFFQDDIVDETQIDKITFLCSPQNYQV